MIEAESRLTEVETLMRNMPPAKQAALLDSIAKLFVENVARYRPAQISLFDRLFNRLIGMAGKDSAAALARRLAPLENAPVTIIGRLARDDDIVIAEPVLLRSPCIEDSLLVEIARAKGQTHLLAIACRPRLAEDIVDLLLARGDEVVVRYVANNRGARISEAGAAILIERAKSDETLAILVGRRGDIAPHLLAQLPGRAIASSGHAAA
jgi:uncharacterized protein (DUF2336 family)